VAGVELGVPRCRVVGRPATCWLCTQHTRRHLPASALRLVEHVYTVVCSARVTRANVTEAKVLVSEMETLLDQSPRVWLRTLSRIVTPASQSDYHSSFDGTSKYS
jgi:hypothetical protein